MSSSQSDASQSQTQESADNRIAGAGESVNLVANRSSLGNLTLNTTDHGAVESSFKFGDALTKGALTFAGKASDNSAKVINATVDSAFKAIDSTAKTSFAGMRAAQDSSNRLVNAVSDSAFKYSDATVGRSFGFAEQIAAGAANEVAASGARSNAVTQSAMESVKSAYAANGEKLATAYENSKAGEQKVMVGAALAVVAVVALKALGRGA